MSATSAPSRRSSVPLLALALSVTLLAGGCATTNTTGADPQRPRVAADPWENWNRKVYAFNDTLDEAVLKPVATAYTNVVPEPVRRGVSNFFGNFADAWSAVNNFLQGKVGNGFQDIMRVGVNTVFGLGGFLDVATEAGIERQREDFGQTLGRWGAGPGPYVVWPLLGPSSVRDSFGLPLDIYASPTGLVEDSGARVALGGLNIVNTRAGLLGATGMLDDIALDKYSFIRDAYLQRRRSLVYDGQVPEADDDDFEYDPALDGDAPAAPAAPAAAASAAADAASVPAAPASAASAPAQ